VDHAPDGAIELEHVEEEVNKGCHRQLAQLPLNSVLHECKELPEVVVCARADALDPRVTGVRRSLATQPLPNLEISAFTR
jgi:hypothetical protein